MEEKQQASQIDPGSGAQDNSIAASERGVAVGRDVSNSAINTGDINVQLQVNVTPPAEPAIQRLDRAAQLNELGRASKARCIERWQAAGLRRDEAMALAEDPSVGAIDPALQPRTDRPVLLLIGELGAGKSLIAERLLQGAIARARENINAPIPVYLEAQSCVSQLQESVERFAERLGNPHVQGATIIVDGADEVGVGPAVQLLAESRVLADTWPNTTVVLTSRPLPTLARVEESVQVLLLSEAEAHALIDRLLERPAAERIAYRLPQSVRDAIRRPLFAILLAVYLREQDMRVPHSKGEMLASLVEHSLGRTQAHSANVSQLLQRLAVLSTARRGSPVPAAEIASKAEQQQLVNTGLVADRSGMLAFPLPILTQWFAAQSLATGIPLPGDLVRNPQQLENWRYALIIFASTFSHQQVSRLISPLAERYPAFTSEIIDESLARSGFSEEASPPAPLECGQRVRAAMQSWVRGIGPLAQLIAPIRRDGALMPIGVRIDGSHLVAAWYHGDNDVDEVVELPHRVGLFRQFPRDWIRLWRAQPGHQSAWAWQWSLQELTSSLSQLLQRRALPINSGPLADEEIWRTALAITDRGSLYPGPIQLSELEEILVHLPESALFQRAGGRLCDPARLRAAVNRLRDAGETELHCPWPGPDRDFGGGGWIWEPYSPEQTLARARAVYSAALEGHRQLVNKWFPTLAPRLQTAATLPARLTGILAPARPGSGFEGAPAMRWHLEPLPHDSQNEIAISLDEELPNLRYDDDDDVNSLYERVRLMRPHAMAWIGAVIQDEVLDIFHVNPATELVYEWLWDDLQQVSWVEGLLGNPR
ncbi:MAG TPA: hypothetical protein VJ793_09605 [Anaerolineae bacterium]|nr:hypothetical protein [Anaerolineae bacterium]